MFRIPRIVITRILLRRWRACVGDLKFVIFFLLGIVYVHLPNYHIDRRIMCYYLDSDIE